MKNFVFTISVLLLLVSCKKEFLKEPKRLIPKEKMIDIMYDLSILEAMKYQNPLSVDSVDTAPAKFLLKKHKVDSLQFSESNKYYATDYKGYKKMFDEIDIRLEKEKKTVDSLVKKENKKSGKKNLAEPKKISSKHLNANLLRKKMEHQ